MMPPVARTSARQLLKEVIKGGLGELITTTVQIAESAERLRQLYLRKLIEGTLKPAQLRDRREIQRPQLTIGAIDILYLLSLLAEVERTDLIIGTHNILKVPQAGYL